MNIKLFARAIVSNSNVSPLKMIIDIVEFSFCSNKRQKKIKTKKSSKIFQRKLNII